MVDLEVLSQPSMFQMAQAGDFRAIAYWLNTHLVPQEIYARVAADRPGYLLVLVEFMRPPSRERLNRFICHRLCQLRSQVIQGVRIIARFPGSQLILWDQSIRLKAVKSRKSRPAVPAQKRVQVKKRVAPTRSRTPVRKPSVGSAGRPKSSRVIESSHRFRPFHLTLLASSAAAAFIIGYGMINVLQQMTPSFNLREGSIASQDEQVHTATGSVGVPELPVTLAFGGNPVLTQTPVSPPKAPYELAIAESETSQPSSQVYDAPSDPMPAVRVQRPTGEDDVANQPADITLTNLESPLTLVSLQSGASGQLGRQPVLPAAAKGETLLKANADDLTQTLDELEKAGLRSVGMGRNERDARQPEIVDVRGKRIAYLGYTDSDQNAAGAWTAGTNPALAERISKDIQSIRNQVDWVIVNYHWSQDLASYPSDRQIQLARLAVDAGADLVVGYHADMLQGAEVYKGRAIAYSLGDFIFPDAGKPSKTDFETAMLKVSLKENQMRLEFLPVEVKKSKPIIAQGPKALEIMRYLDQASALFEHPLQSPIILERLTETDPKGTSAPPPTPVKRTPITPSTPAATPQQSEVSPQPEQSDSFTTDPAATDTDAETEKSVDTASPEATTPASEPTPEAEKLQPTVTPEQTQETPAEPSKEFQPKEPSGSFKTEPFINMDPDKSASPQTAAPDASTEADASTGADATAMHDPSASTAPAAQSESSNGDSASGQ